MLKIGDKRRSLVDTPPLNLAAKKRSKFMINHLLDEENDCQRRSNSAELAGIDINEENEGSVRNNCDQTIKITNDSSKESCNIVYGSNSIATSINSSGLDRDENAVNDADDFETKFSAKILPAPGLSPSLKELNCRLEGRELWCKFYDLNTEMIITKSGRRMFPTVKVGLSGCDPHSIYYVFLDVVPVDSKRYRYIYNKSSWLTAGKAEPAPRNRLYMHPDSPFIDEQLSKQIISFEKAKLTNNEVDKAGHLILNSMHKYQPRIHIVKRPKDTPINQSESIDLHKEDYKTFQFIETQFMAVTAYQNQLITKLKIEKNPFAKGFRDPSGRSPEYDNDGRPDFPIMLPAIYPNPLMQQALLNQYWMGKMQSRLSVPNQILSRIINPTMALFGAPFPSGSRSSRAHSHDNDLENAKHFPVPNLTKE